MIIKMEENLNWMHKNLVMYGGTNILNKYLEIYDSLPSCKHLTGEPYFNCMFEKSNQIYEMLLPKLKNITKKSPSESLDFDIGW